ncbi:Ribose transport system permease protein RbsC [Clavibacter michiganensis]|uniref:Ribose transport system permease protein RbsC n=1 Tax=Clavibacter michiganensis TaxID=28447 RepID=A0A251YV41_9MICO|nr:ABC transporter permease [Clavibacter michiganensis]OUE28124.1 Ribose transport system permease protein RbsC [Clavibacter michiganensis]
MTPPETRSIPTRPKRTLNLQAVGIYLAAVVLFVVLGVLNPNFLTVGNLRDVAVSASVNAIIGIGITFVIITGGIDLAVGAMASFVGIVSSTLMVGSGLPPVVALVAGIALGVAAGAVNGLLVTKLSLPPFIATLGTMSVFQGAAYVATNGKPVYDIPPAFVLLLNSYVGGVPIVVIVVAVVGVAAWLLLRKTVFGQNVIAVGGSEETAWLSGVRVHRVKIAVYCIAGGLSGLAGLVIVARINAAQPDAGSPYQLTAIAAAVIGGANLMGGEGRIAGTLVGALILGALTNGLVLLNVPSFYEQIVTGLVVLIAVTLDQGGKGWPMLSRAKRRRQREEEVAAPATSSMAAVDR